MPTNTTNLSLKKPIVGADEDVWGGYINDNLDDLDDYLSGNTAIPALDVAGDLTLSTQGSEIKFAAGNTSVNKISVVDTSDFASAEIVFRGVDANQTQNIEFWTGSSPASEDISLAATIDKSGHFIVGKAAIDGTASTGVELRAAGTTYISRNGANTLYVNRDTDDGSIIELRQGGAPIGNIGTDGSHIFVGSNDVGLRFRDSADQIQPYSTSGVTRDAAIDLGAAGVRFKDLYLSGGVYLGGTTSSNYLYDYEFGTWTPAMSAYAGTVTSYGEYFKVGDMVTASFSVTLDGTSDGSAWRISNLPFNWDNSVTSGGSWGGCITKQNAGLDGHSFQVVTTNDVLIYNSSGATRSYNAIGVTSNIRGVVTYKT
jgi:hypothetical protein